MDQFSCLLSSSSDPVFAAVQWISEVWQLFNHYVNKMGLSEVLAGRSSHFKFNCIYNPPL